MPNLNEYVDLVTQNEKYRKTLLTDLGIEFSSLLVLGAIWFLNIPPQDKLRSTLQIFPLVNILIAGVRHNHIDSLRNQNILTMKQLIDKTIHPR